MDKKKSEREVNYENTLITRNNELNMEIKKKIEKNKKEISM